MPFYDPPGDGISVCLNRWVVSWMLPFMKILVSACACLLGWSGCLAAEVRLERVPEKGLQPQVARGPDGTVHLVCLTGNPSASEVLYRSRKVGGEWSSAVTVNHLPHTAVAMGTIRGSQIAVGPEGTVHVVWNGPGANGVPASLFYTRLSCGAVDGFEPQRDLRGNTRALDGGASVATDAAGGVFILWHGSLPESPPGEDQRRIFLARSVDQGRTFGAVEEVQAGVSGVCACCSLKAFVAPSGEWLALYRAARRVDQRDVTLLRSRDGGRTFESSTVGPWALGACPMSSMALAGSGAATRGVWEAEGLIATALFGSGTTPAPLTLGPGRHPALAVNRRGETLVSWSEGTGWQRGGQLRWRLLDASGRPGEVTGSAPGMPVWGSSAVFVEGDDFVVLY